MIEGIVEPALLFLLVERDSYGYELASEIERRGLVPQRVSPARVYEALRRLEEEGAVSGNREASPVGPDRRRYALTPSGRDRLDRWAEVLGMTERSLRTLLDSYGTQRKEVKSMMGCNCSCRESDGSESRSEDQEVRVEREEQSLEERIARLEAELRALRSEA